MICRVRYLPFIGSLELRQKVADHLIRLSSIAYDPEQQCVITAGGTEGIFNALLATLNSGDEVLLTDRNMPPASPPEIQITIRRAQSSEADLLSALAQAGKRYWGYPDEWLRAWRDELTLTPAYITTHTVPCACIEGGRVVGFYALESDDIGFRLAHLWLEPSFIGQGLGRRMFDHAAQTASSLGARELQIVADPNAEGFYVYMGAERVGESVSLMTGIKRVIPHLRYKLKEHS